MRWYTHKSVSVVGALLAFLLLTKVRRHALHQRRPMTDWILPSPPINGNSVPGERRVQPRPQLLLPPSFLCETESWLTNVPKILDTHTHTHTHIYIYIYIHSCRRNRLHKFYHAPRAPRRNVELLFVSLELRSSFLRFCSSWRPSIRKFSPAMAYWF